MNKKAMLWAGGAGLVAALFLRQQKTEGETAVYPQPSPGTALITGASSGIGAVYARQLAQDGYNLIITARRESKLNVLATELQQAYGVKVDVVAADLAKTEDVEALAERISKLDKLDILINNAGFGTTGPFHETALHKHHAMNAVHINATLSLCHAAIPNMVARQRGVIINVASIAAFFANHGNSVYSASKMYLNNFSKSLSDELHDSGITVQSLCPGYTYSEFHDTSEYDNFNREDISGQLWMTAQEVVDISLAELNKREVIVIPGLKNKLIVKAINSPVTYGIVQSIWRRIRRSN